MALPNFDENGVWAGVLAVLTGAAGLVYRAYYRVRGDARLERHKDREERSDKTSFEGFWQIVGGLREEVDRQAKVIREMAATLNAMSIDLGEERRRRYEAEAATAQLKLRVASLENELVVLRGGR